MHFARSGLVRSFKEASLKVECRDYELQLQDPFTISRGTVTTQPTLIVRVEYDGLIGLGEATTNEFYGVTLDSMRRALAEVQPRLDGYRLENPAELWADLDPVLSQARFAQCALDCAIWDIYAQMHGMPLFELWGFRRDDPMPPTSFTIGIDSADEMVRKLNAQPGWPIYKIKLPGQSPVELVKALRRHSEATFRVDANCAWQEAEVLSIAGELQGLGVELIEQPLESDAYDKMARLKGRSAIPLVADESCQTEADIDRCIDCFDGVNLKLVKCGGLTPARRMATRARQNGLKVMLGCMTESSVGIAAGVHMLPLLDFADLDGAMLLREDIATGLDWQLGVCRLPERPGIGVQLL